MGKFLLGLLLVSLMGQAQGLRFWGSWQATVELLPTLRVYQSDLVLNLAFAPGWRLESESKFYTFGEYRYQNFFLSGTLGDLRTWGKVYFHARDVRYQKVWLNAEARLSAGTLRSSFNHWASAADYTSGDRSLFGPWPCLEVVSWEEAWKFMGREVQVTGPVRGWFRFASGAVALYLGEDWPHPDRFQIYIPPGDVPAFEAAFGPAFWTTWVGRTVCVRGTVKGYRYGPAGGGYSVAEVSLASPAALTLGSCPGVRIAPVCPGPTLRWFEARDHVGKTVYVQGPVASITGPGTYHGYAGHYRIRLGGGADWAHRVEVILPYHPGWSTVGLSYTREVCVGGRISLIGGVAVILPPDVVHVSGSACCGGGLPGTFLNWRFRYALAPWTLTVDLGDCGTGLTLRQLSVEGKGLPLCCGLSYEGVLTFAKGGLISLELTLKRVPFLCCGLTADLSVALAPEGKTLSFTPTWRGIRGCFSVYGDVLWEAGTWRGLSVYGWRAHCRVGEVRLEAGMAFDRVRMNEVSPLSFRSGEWAYLGLTFQGEGCCGGDLWFNVDLWFGDGTFLFGLRRIKLNLELPLTPTWRVFTRGVLDLARAAPLEYWNIGGKLSF